jgi:cytoskeletal protein RodZ
MSNATNQALSEAYELIEADRLAEAEAILKPILADEPNNADAWWLYSYAVTDVETARMALNTVLHLDSNYPGAAELLKTLEEKYPEHTSAKSEIRKLASQPPSLPDLPEDEDMEPVVNYLDDSEPILARDRQMKHDPPVPKPAKRPSRLPIYAGLVLLVLLVIALVLLVLRPGVAPSTALTPTSVQQAAAMTPTTDSQQTDEASVDQQTEAVTAPTEETTAEATVSPLEAEVTPVSDTAANSVQGALSDFTLAVDGIGTLDTQLGTTLVAGVCTTSGQQLRDTLTGSMNALSAVADTIGNSEAIGVRLVNCETSEVLRVIAVPIAEAATFAAGQSDDAAYQSKWVAVA